MPESSQPFTTKSGRVLSDADVEALADGAERGYDVEDLERRRRGRPMLGSAPAEVVPVRLDPELKQAGPSPRQRHERERDHPRSVATVLGRRVRAQR